MKIETKKLVMLAMFSALAFILVTVGRIPIVLFLKYDPKDVLITISGFIFGPLSALLVSTVVSFVEMITISDNGVIGFVMNIISTGSFACVASFVYKKGKKTNKSAIVGLILGCITMVCTMLLWNYLIAPIYMGVPRKDVVKLLIPAFFPFNLIKGGLNAAFTMLLYKPLLKTFKAANMDVGIKDEIVEKSNKGVILLSVFVLIACTLFILAINNKF
ncbi:TPA: ECF transporter S component [Streptococcus equi subsp. zooepidemicus]|nr:ECF transporter S component [Streptococcus equi subsp. zooepidemicus]